MLKTSLLLSAGLVFGALAMSSDAATVDLGSEGTMLNNGGTLASQWIRSDDSTRIAGPEVIFVGSLDSGADLRGIVAFDLSGFNVGDTINDVTLSVYHGTNDIFNGSDGTNSSATLELSQVTNAAYVNNGGSWDNADQGGAVAWGTAGGDFGAALATVAGLDLTTITTDDEVAFNSAGLTAAVQTAVAAGDSDIAFFLHSPDLEATTTRNFFVFQGTVASGSGSSIGPNLHVDFVPEPGSIALLGLGGLTLLRRRRG